MHPPPYTRSRVQVIVDLRGPQAKLLTRLDEINYEMEVRVCVYVCVGVGVGVWVWVCWGVCV
jgi:hypothetical protein